MTSQDDDPDASSKGGVPHDRSTAGHDRGPSTDPASQGGSIGTAGGGVAHYVLDLAPGPDGAPVNPQDRDDGPARDRHGKKNPKVAVLTGYDSRASLASAWAMTPETPADVGAAGSAQRVDCPLSLPELEIRTAPTIRDPASGELYQPRDVVLRCPGAIAGCIKLMRDLRVRAIRLPVAGDEHAAILVVQTDLLRETRTGPMQQLIVRAIRRVRNSGPGLIISFVAGAATVAIGIAGGVLSFIRGVLG